MPVREIYGLSVREGGGQGGERRRSAGIKPAPVTKHAFHFLIEHVWDFQQLESAGVGPRGSHHSSHSLKNKNNNQQAVESIFLVARVDSWKSFVLRRGHEASRSRLKGLTKRSIIQTCCFQNFKSRKKFGLLTSPEVQFISGQHCKT